jgi:Fe-S oxidoreductase
VAIFATCYGNYNSPDLGEDLVKVLEHNGISVSLVDREQCCGMPKLELGDLESVARAKQENIPVLAKMVDLGWDIMAPVPSCILMFRQELPLLFPDDEDVRKVAQAMFDPFEYLMMRHREGLLDTAFKNSLGKVAYHIACHQRVQKIGQKTRQCLELIPGTEVLAIERCSGHDGTYGVKSKSYEVARKIVRPVINRVKQFEPDYHGSDCPMAGKFIAHVLDDGTTTSHPISLVRKAYGI